MTIANIRLKTARRVLALALGAGVCAAPGVALAQSEGLIVNPSVPFEYDRDRNVSILQKARPDYDALGIRSGGFLIFPTVDAGIGYSSNVYLSESNERDAPFAELTGSVRANSDWSRHQVSASLGGTARRFIGESARNEDTWRASVLGRADIGAYGAVTGEAQAGKVYETPFSGGIEAPNIALSSYAYAIQTLRGQYILGRTKFSAGYTHSEFDFNDIIAPDGVRTDQSNRDRTIHQLVGQAEYALSPGASVYGQLSYAHVDYDRLLSPGVANRESDGYRALAGVSFDLPAFVRGTLAAGYTTRRFDSPLYKDAEGLSVEARVEWFATELTTVTVAARRVLEDASLGDSSAYFDNRLLAQVDHELLRNLILSASGEYARQTYVDSDRSNDVYRLGTIARYLVSPLIALSGRVTYSRRDRDGLNNVGTMDELRGVATITFHR